MFATEERDSKDCKKKSLFEDNCIIYVFVFLTIASDGEKHLNQEKKFMDISCSYIILIYIHFEVEKKVWVKHLRNMNFVRG